MPVEPEYKHDIFVSYAHVDNEPAPGTDEGWVTTFVNGLKAELARKLGRKEAASVWFDPQFSRTEKISPQVLEILENSATMLVILSPGYLASDWCEWERETFLEIIQKQKSPESRIIIVEVDQIPDAERPTEFHDVKGYKFWVDRAGGAPRRLGYPKPNPDDLRYFDLLIDLCYDLAGKLKRLRKHAGTLQPSVDTQPAIFLAEVTDDLEPKREEVERYLIQDGLRVLPQTRYKRDPTAFRQGLIRDLAKCKFFVQLLSDPDKKTEDLPQGYLGLQYQQAVAAGKPILQWRDTELHIAQIPDKEHRKLLQNPSVLATSLAEFKAEVVKRARQKPVPETARSTDALVFVNNEDEDLALAEEVCKIVKRKGFSFARPMRGGKPAKIRKDLEGNLVDCNALIVIYGSIAVAWVREQLQFYRKIGHQRLQPLSALAVYEGPPAEKADLNYYLKDMQTLDCRQGLDEAKLEEFLDSVKHGGEA